ncbi:MAG: holo-ACP synthase [candidate division WOR-3 bacterium]|nr:MAG: holo-ACP synthase [candidate division WOR-3 bacterium]
MSIIGVGIDMVEVERIKNAVNKRKNFLEKIYTIEEIKTNPRGEFRFQELAGRFAVKEAFFKAIKSGWRRGVTFSDVIVLNEPSGAPYIKLTGKAKEIADSLGVKKIFVSISHTTDLATGIVIITDQ